MSTITLPDRQYLLLHDVSWDDFRNFERMVDDQPGHRLTYDRGRLEYMTISWLHENLKKRIDRLLFALVEEMDLPIASGGTTTFRREDLDRGFEPDECYYLANEPLIHDKREIDLTVDPPPDLLIEIEVSRSALDRLGIFAVLGIPEVWCADAESIRFLHLNQNREYEEQSESINFPGIRSAELATFLKEHEDLNELALVKAFRQWVRTQGEPGA
jgi:Uma2 family endonuclease